MLDCVELEMRMAELMSQQEASGFRFDMDAAERVRSELSDEMEQLQQTIQSRFIYVPGKVFTPKRKNGTKGHVAGAPFTKLLEFNPTSRQHICSCRYLRLILRSRIYDYTPQDINNQLLFGLSYNYRHLQL